LPKGQCNASGAGFPPHVFPCAFANYYIFVRITSPTRKPGGVGAGMQGIFPNASSWLRALQARERKTFLSLIGNYNSSVQCCFILKLTIINIFFIYFFLKKWREFINLTQDRLTSPYERSSTSARREGYEKKWEECTGQKATSSIRFCTMP